ncbi:MAG TPA: hypothetical protein VJV39_11970 [Dongiaceae bacterium]|nr:hypothetical protein [Dongiaceae bacterium]
MLVAIAMSLPARTECPSENSSDSAGLAAHTECKRTEMFAASQRADSARQRMMVRLSELYLLLTSEGDKILEHSQSIWQGGTEACPPAPKDVDQMTAHANCLEGVYTDRAKFLDQRLAECKSVGCQLDRL